LVDRCNAIRAVICSRRKAQPFKSRLVGVASQIRYPLVAAGMEGYVNLKAYGEFDARDRPSRWNAWLTLSISATGTPSAENSDELGRSTGQRTSASLASSLRLERAKTSQADRF
jgi:hypothetical protein